MMAAEARATHGEIRLNEPMSKHTSWRVGGKADLFFIPDSVEHLQAYLRDLDADDRQAFRIHGVNRDFVDEVADMGFQDDDSGDLIAFRIHRINGAFVERMADMGGTLEIESAPGKGCKATLVVPLRDDTG